MIKGATDAAEKTDTAEATEAVETMATIETTEAAEATEATEATVKMIPFAPYMVATGCRNAPSSEMKDNGFRVVKKNNNRNLNRQRERGNNPNHWYNLRPGNGDTNNRSTMI